MKAPGAAAVVVATLVAATATTARARDRTPSVADIRDTIESASPACRLDVDDELVLGRSTLWLARRVVRMADDVDPQARAVLEGLRRVEVGSYRVVGDPDACALPIGLESDLVDRGWTRTARWQDESGRGVVLQRVNDDDQIDGMLVLEIDDTSVEIVHLEGRVQNMLAAAVRDDPASTGPLLGVN